MKKEELLNELKLELTGNVLDLEISDSDLEAVINKSLREVQRYIDSTEFVTVPYAQCIDMKDFPVSSVSRVYKPLSAATTYVDGTESNLTDPVYTQMYTLYGGGLNTYNLSNYVNNYAAYLTARQILNTTTGGTDLSFLYDKGSDKLYINTTGVNGNITIEYVPKLVDVEDIKSDYWIDVLLRLSVAQTKIIVGRVRSRYKLQNALWANDGDTLLNEGTSELNALRETLRTNSTYMYGID